MTDQLACIASLHVHCCLIFVVVFLFHIRTLDFFSAS